MRKLIETAAASLLIVVASSGAARASEPCRGESEVLVVRAGQLIDGTGGAPRRGLEIVIRDGRIASVGAPEAADDGPCVRRLDAGDATVLPGLADAHVHLSGVLRGSPETVGSWIEQGVTTLVDLGSPRSADELREALAATGQLSPRVFPAGRILTARGGYPFVGPRSSALEVDDEASAIAAVGDLADSGAALVKVAVERGFLADLDEPGWPVPEAGVLRAIVEAAHARGLRVSAHVTQPGELAATLAAGVDSIAHTPIEPLDDGQIEELARRGTVLVTSISLWTDATHVRAVCSNLRRLLDAGGHVALGTDAPAFQAPGLPWVEIERLAACPLTPMEIVVAATHGVARVVGREGELGVVSPGALADLLVVAGDPLAGLAALRRVRAVVARGRTVAPQGTLR